MSFGLIFPLDYENLHWQDPEVLTRVFYTIRYILLQELEEVLQYLHNRALQRNHLVKHGCFRQFFDESNH